MASIRQYIQQKFEKGIIDPVTFLKANIQLSQAEELVKARRGGGKGEGSRGGKIIGHTSSGKPIYDTAAHQGHMKFTADEHRDAARMHSSHAQHHKQQEQYGSKTMEDRLSSRKSARHHQRQAFEHDLHAQKADAHERAEHHKKMRDMHEDIKNYIINTHGGGAGGGRHEDVSAAIQHHREQADYHDTEHIKHNTRKEMINLDK